MNYAERRARNAARKDLQHPERLYLLEEDLDEHDRQFARLRRELQEEMAGLRSELQTTNKILIGLLVTIAGGAIMGALNLIYA